MGIYNGDGGIYQRNMARAASLKWLIYHQKSGDVTIKRRIPRNYITNNIQAGLSVYMIYVNFQCFSNHLDFGGILFLNKPSWQMVTRPPTHGIIGIDSSYPISIFSDSLAASFRWFLWQRWSSNLRRLLVFVNTTILNQVFCNILLLINFAW